MTLTNYWWLLIWVAGAGVCCSFLFAKRTVNFYGHMEERWELVPALILVIPYIIWAGYRSDVWGDSPLSSKKQKNNCRQRHLGSGFPFFNSFQGICSLAAA